jgi:cell wall-associated NlpC family hydrolase
MSMFLQTKTAPLSCANTRLQRGRAGWKTQLTAFALVLVAPCLQAQTADDALDPQAILEARPSAAPAPAARHDDPVGQMLEDRGLIDTRAILDAARQTHELASAKVRDWASDLVISSMGYLGVPYRFGGNSQETGFDCSGFTSHVYQHVLGIKLPRRASEQAQMSGMQNVDVADLKPGDLVFFNTLRRAFSHVGIYIGNNRFIHAPRSGTVVRIEDMGLSYWQQRFNGARRAEVINPPAPARQAP